MLSVTQGRDWAPVHWLKGPLGFLGPICMAAWRPHITLVAGAGPRSQQLTSVRLWAQEAKSPPRPREGMLTLPHNAKHLPPSPASCPQSTPARVADPARAGASVQPVAVAPTGPRTSPAQGGQLWGSWVARLVTV